MENLNQETKELITEKEISDVYVAAAKVNAAGFFMSEFHETELPNTQGFSLDMGLKLMELGRAIQDIMSTVEGRHMGRNKSQES